MLSYMANCITSEEVKKLCDSDTKWKVLFPTNLNVCIYRGPMEFPIGGKCVRLRKGNARAGVRNFPGKDNLCVFRCIAFHLYKTADDCNELLARYDPTGDPRLFRGVHLSEFSILEALFDVEIAVYKRQAASTEGG